MPVSSLIPLLVFSFRLWEEGIPSEGIRPFKDLSAKDWSATPPPATPKAYAPAHKFNNWQVVLGGHLSRLVTDSKPTLSGNLKEVEQYLLFAGACRMRDRSGDNRKLNIQPLHNKMRTVYYNMMALDRKYTDASAIDAAFAIWKASK